MKVQIGEKEYIISWRFESPMFEKILENNGITPQRANEIMEEKIEDTKRPGCMRRRGIEGLVQMLGLKKIPLPSTTTCVIKEVGHDERVLSATVRRFPGTVMKGGHVVKADPFNKDTARKASLHKVLKQSFPEKADRVVFWESYLTRHNVVNVRKEESV